MKNFIISLIQKIENGVLHSTARGEFFLTSKKNELNINTKISCSMN